MLAALIIVFREVFEAGLIVGIMLAVTRGVAHRNRWVAGGVLAGVAGACLVAAFAGGLSQLFEGMGQELFNAAILGVAVVMLTWHNVWMAGHGREIAERALHTLIGYTDQPTQMQLLVYLAVIAITSWLMRLTTEVRADHAVAPE